MGTAAFRDSEWSKAAENWEILSNLSLRVPAEQSIQTMGQTNLAFLKYYGLGVERDRVAAVSDWKRLASLGAVEARKHLGVAYSDLRFEGRDWVSALAWHYSVLEVLPDADDLDETDRQIRDQSLTGVTQLKRRLSDAEIQRATDLMKEILPR